MATYKSPVDLDYAYITDATIHISASPDGYSALEYSLELGRPARKAAPVINELKGRILLDYRLSVKTKASVGGTSERVLDVELIVDGRVSADQKATPNMKAEHAERWLEANAVSLLYAKARAYVEYVTAMSPFGVHSLPTIDPYAFLDGVGAGA